MDYIAAYGDTIHTLLDHPYFTLRLAVVDAHIKAMTWRCGELRAAWDALMNTALADTQAEEEPADIAYDGMLHSLWEEAERLEAAIGSHR